MIVARQSTARTVTVGPVLDASGVAVTTEVVGNFKIKKNGAASAALNGSATLTHDATGHYTLALTTSDLDTVGQAEIIINDTTNACPVKELMVIEEAVYDALFAAAAAGYLLTSGYTAPDNAGVAAIQAKTDNLPTSPAATGDAMTLTSAYDFAKGTVAVTESYNADGSAPTPVQALLLCTQMLTEMSISGTTMTVKKLDGATTAFTLTINDATTPTSVTRAT